MRPLLAAALATLLATAASAKPAIKPADPAPAPAAPSGTFTFAGLEADVDKLQEKDARALMMLAAFADGATMEISRDSVVVKQGSNVKTHKVAAIASGIL